MPLDSSYDGFVLRYRHSDASFILVEQASASEPPEMVGSFTATTNTGNTTSHVINTPSHISGDYIFIAFASDANSNVASVSGFTVLYNSLGIDGTEGIFALFYKVAGGSEPSTYTISSTVSERGVGMAWAVRGVGGIHLTGTSTFSAPTTTISFPTATSTVDNCLRMNIGASNKDTRPFGTMTGYTSLGDAGISSGGALCVFYKDLPTAGTDGTAVVTQTVSEGWRTGTILLAPL